LQEKKSSKYCPISDPFNQKKFLYFDPHNRLLSKLGLFNPIGIYFSWLIGTFLFIVVFPLFTSSFFIGSVKIPAILDITTIIDNLIIVPALFILGYMQVHIHINISSSIKKRYLGNSDSFEELYLSKKQYKIYKYIILIVFLFFVYMNVFFGKERLADGTHWYGANKWIAYFFYTPYTSWQWLVGFLPLPRFVIFCNKISKLYRENKIELDLLHPDGFYGLRPILSYASWIMTSVILAFVHVILLTNNVFLFFENNKLIPMIKTFKYDTGILFVWSASLPVIILISVLYYNIFPKKKQLEIHYDSLEEIYLTWRKNFMEKIKLKNKSPEELLNCLQAQEKFESWYKNLKKSPLRRQYSKSFQSLFGSIFFTSLIAIAAELIKEILF